MGLEAWNETYCILWYYFKLYTGYVQIYQGAQVWNKDLQDRVSVGEIIRSIKKLNYSFMKY